MEQETGIVYIAVGAAFVKDAERAAQSARRQHPELPICLFSDVPSADPVFDINLPIKDPHRRSKLDCIIQTPFRKTLYLDTDTRVIGSIMEPFGLLDRYDLAACHVENRHPVSSATSRLKAEGVEAGFTGFNGGVFYYRMNDSVRSFFETLGRGVQEGERQVGPAYHAQAPLGNARGEGDRHPTGIQRADASRAPLPVRQQVSATVAAPSLVQVKRVTILAPVANDQDLARLPRQRGYNDPRVLPLMAV